MEKFKVSKRAICHNCKNINETCEFVSKSCETDNKIGLGFVSRCSLFNMDFKETKKENYFVTVDNASDTRIEMMGGGFKD